jgi:pimeloyl-ACP methyl ester carboxylesterase
MAYGADRHWDPLPMHNMCYYSPRCGNTDQADIFMKAEGGNKQRWIEMPERKTMDWQEGRIDWVWDGKSVAIGTTRYGSGPNVLLLPALSSISTRREMRPLQEKLGSSFCTVAVDWPGFGDLPRPKIAWSPTVYGQFLKYVIGEIVRPAATIAAGHAAGYVVAQAADIDEPTGPLCLVSPTWRGPLKTMAGKPLALFRWLAQAVDLPVLGPLLYRLNVNPPIVRMMARGHVYADAGWLSFERLKDKLAVVDAAGARHASVRFVAGELDPFDDRSGILRAASRIKAPTLVIYAAGSPRKSKAEMAALAALSNIVPAEVPQGKLSVHEEFPEVVAPIILDFLRSNLR